MKRSKFLASTIVLAILLTELVLLPSIANAAGCTGGGWQFASPGNCVIAYSDQGIAGGNSNPTIDQCDDVQYGLTLSTGFDYLSYVSLSSLRSDGKITPGSVVMFNVVIRQACRAWKGAYKLSVALIGADGSRISAVMQPPEFKYDEQYSAPITSYCFANTCGSGTYSGTFSIPPSLPSGAMSLDVVLVDDPTTFSISMKPIRAEMNFSGALFNGTPTPTPTPTPTVSSPTPTATNPTSVLLALPSEVPSFEASLAHVSFTLQLNQGTFQAFEVSNKIIGYAIRAIGPTGIIKNFNNFSISPGLDHSYLTWDGSGYTPGIWLIELAGINSSGQGAWSVPQVVTVPVATPAVVPLVVTKVQKKSSITCIKGKSAKKITALKPICPKGYKIK